MKRAFAAAAGIALIAAGAHIAGRATRVQDANERSTPWEMAASTPLARALAPLSTALAARELIAADAAFNAGRIGAGFEHLARAHAVRPGASAAWEESVQRQGLWLASSLREGDPAVRTAWIEGALATARVGIERADRPSRVAWAAATVLAVQAESEPLPPWPGGAPELLREAARWFEKAHGLGDHRGAQAALWSAQRAAEVEAPPRDAIDGR